MAMQQELLNRQGGAANDGENPMGNAFAQADAEAEARAAGEAMQTGEANDDEHYVAMQ